MALSIKNPKTEQLAHAVAKETGESLTQAITHALEERLHRLRGSKRAPDLLETIMAISSHCASLPDIDTRNAEQILGYDESGTFA